MLYLGVRSVLLESESHECPGCHEKDISPSSLIPNRFKRNAVNAFKNETGYIKAPKVPETTKEEPSKRRSLEELPADLFPHSPRRVGTESESNDAATSADIGMISLSTAIS